MSNPAGEVRQLRKKQYQFVPITLPSVNIQKEPYFICALSAKSHLLGLVSPTAKISLIWTKGVSRTTRKKMPLK